MGSQLLGLGLEAGAAGQAVAARGESGPTMGSMAPPSKSAPLLRPSWAQLHIFQ